MDFPDAVTFTGSGIRILEREIVLSTSTHTLAPLYIIDRALESWASNSLPTVLAMSGTALDTAYPYYDADIMSIVLGIEDYVRAIPLAGGERLELHYFSNIRLDSSARREVNRKNWTRRFHDFGDYFGFISTEVAAVVANARDGHRKKTYQPLVTLSSGYDSPACAVLGRLAGARSAITISEAREGFADRNDSGAEIGSNLGFESVTEIPREQALKPSRPQAELEILATGYGGDDLIWAGLEGSLRGYLVIAGYHGDRLWSTRHAYASAHVRRGDPSGGSLLEFRLSAGFLVLPVPFIGCLAHPDIHRISTSEEMAPWRLNNDYDRPIPRRIVETFGIRRELFGQSKKAVAQPYQDTDAENPPLEKCFSADLIDAYRQSCRIARPSRSITKRASDALVRRLIGLSATRTLAMHLGFMRKLRHARWRYRKPVTEHNFLTSYAANVLSRRYRDARTDRDGPDRTAPSRRVAPATAADVTTGET